MQKFNQAALEITREPKHCALSAVAAGWQARRCSRLLVVAVDRVLPLGEPRHRVDVVNLAPLVRLAVAHVRHRRHLRALAQVERHVLRHHARLQHAHLRVLPAAAEEPGRLDAEIAHLLSPAVNRRVQEGRLQLVLRRLLRRLLLLRALLLRRRQHRQVVGDDRPATGTRCEQRCARGLRLSRTLAAHPRPVAAQGGRFEWRRSTSRTWRSA